MFHPTPMIVLFVSTPIDFELLQIPGKYEARYKMNVRKKLFLDAIASPSTYLCQSVGEWVSQSVSDSFRFGDS